MIILAQLRIICKYSLLIYFYLIISKIIAFTPTDHVALIKAMQKAGMKYRETKIVPHIGIECVVYEYYLKAIV